MWVYLIEYLITIISERKPKYVSDIAVTAVTITVRHLVSKCSNCRLDFIL